LITHDRPLCWLCNATVVNLGLIPVSGAHLPDHCKRMYNRRFGSCVERHVLTALATACGKVVCLISWQIFSKVLRLQMFSSLASNNLPGGQYFNNRRSVKVSRRLSHPILSLSFGPSNRTMLRILITAFRFAPSMDRQSHLIITLRVRSLTRDMSLCQS
jgi:hypothetical protein